MSEQTFSVYLAGLTKLLDRLGKEHPQYFDVAGFQAQLMENIENALKGDNSDLKSQRGRIIDRLNRISQAALGETFTEICFQTEDIDSSGSTTIPHEHGKEAPEATLVDKRELPAILAYGSLVAALEVELDKGTQIYPDQCQAYIDQLKELDRDFSEYNFSLPPRYETKTSASYLSAKTESLNELLVGLKDARSPIVIVRLRQEITKIIGDIKTHLE